MSLLCLNVIVVKKKRTRRVDEVSSKQKLKKKKCQVIRFADTIYLCMAEIIPQPCLYYVYVYTNSAAV